jgi:UDP-N-acetyl-D-galactosamine dehydrogenase
VESVVVVGLGYVGLPLAVELAKHTKVYGFDINQERISKLREGIDTTREVADRDLLQDSLSFHCETSIIAAASNVIVTVPTPVLGSQAPDLEPLTKASGMIGENMTPGTLVIFESTVYPGTTEEVCIPILEASSGMKVDVDFHVAYSPERINPGDPTRSVAQIRKLVAGRTPEALSRAADLYDKFLDEPCYQCSSIMVAEAAKVLENTQRDVNIALMNEFSTLMNALGVSTREVLEAAATKWNFLRFHPGLVGGHCIGVDPYYLIHKARELNMDLSVVRSARRINEMMPEIIAKMFVKAYIKSADVKSYKRVLVVGCTFKEDCPDTRNSKVFDLMDILVSYGFEISFYDPVAQISGQVYRGFRQITDLSDIEEYVGVLYCVPHASIQKEIETVLWKLVELEKVILDVRGILPDEFRAVRL